MNWQQLLSYNRVGQRQTPVREHSRSPFEQDFDRIIFSHPFRRLQDKTQVHPLPEQDFVHTRLTHSLEVSSVGRSLGRKVGAVLLDRHPSLKEQFSVVDFGAIVASASLAHDLGNPPFGHAGENAISEFFSGHPDGQKFRERVTAAEWEDLIRFEGNAQGFRILNKNRYGLRLTCATLGAFTKYPVPALFPGRNKARRSQKKFGYFQSEKQVFETLSSELGLHQLSGAYLRHPLAFLVEAADDICYSIIDLEDGCSLGLVSYDEARALFEGVIGQGRSKLGKLDQLSTREERIGFLRALAIGDLTEQCAALFIEKEKEILSGEFDIALADACPARDALKEIIRVSVERIYRSRQVVEIEASGHEVLPGLIEEFVKAGRHVMNPGASRKYANLAQLLPPDVTALVSDDPSNHYNMLRQVIDFVSGLTDRHALSLFRKIRGISR